MVNSRIASRLRRRRRRLSSGRRRIRRPRRRRRRGSNVEELDGAAHCCARLARSFYQLSIVIPFDAWLGLAFSVAIQLGRLALDGYQIVGLDCDSRRIAGRFLECLSTLQTVLLERRVAEKVTTIYVKQ